MKKTTLFILILLLPFLLNAKKNQQEIPQKEVLAIRADSAVVIDGILDESVWQASGYSDFVQSDPEDGGDPTEKTIVWVAYDKENTRFSPNTLYII